MTKEEEKALFERCCAGVDPERGRLPRDAGAWSELSRFIQTQVAIKTGQKKRVVEERTAAILGRVEELICAGALNSGSRFLNRVRAETSAILGSILYERCRRGVEPEMGSTKRDENAWAELRHYIEGIIVKQNFDKNAEAVTEKTQQVTGHITQKMSKGKFKPTKSFYALINRATTNVLRDLARRKEKKIIDRSISIDAQKTTVQGNIEDRPAPGDIVFRLITDECIEKMAGVVFSRCTEDEMKLLDLYMRKAGFDPAIRTLDDMARALDIGRDTMVSRLRRLFERLASSRDVKKLYEECFK